MKAVEWNEGCQVERDHLTKVHAKGVVLIAVITAGWLCVKRVALEIAGSALMIVDTHLKLGGPVKINGVSLELARGALKIPTTNSTPYLCLMRRIFAPTSEIIAFRSDGWFVTTVTMLWLHLEN